MRLVILGLVCLFHSQILFAGAKEDFIKAAAEQCQITEDQAKKNATKGRTGTVVRFKLCLEPEITLPNDCVVRCTKPGSKIGK